jgi:S1-C subfamily serine protease
MPILSNRMNRREFISAMGTTIFTALFANISSSSESFESRLYKELPMNIYASKTISEKLVDKKRGLYSEFASSGLGVIVNGKYLTPAHIVEADTPGPFTLSDILSIHYPPLKNQETTINGKKLEKLFSDITMDIAIFDAKLLNLPNFPYPSAENLIKGQRVYIIGNLEKDKPVEIIKTRIAEESVICPSLRGEGRHYCIGVEAVFKPGYSGRPVVNENLELIGLCNGNTLPPKLGSVISIKRFLKHIDERNQDK